ncbi:ribonuclease D [Hydrogenovibrio kuenenii]|uniref:ribonuclease D n=1 Tax=Hydrogenovibrio kuenenii TaxID=63658 RepID=UPI0004633700|nr:ribonuclease D [Hydrogenovibrio kuenenii]
MPYQYITQPDDLSLFCASLSNQTEWIAIDTEFVRTDTYYPELSLIQVQSDSGIAAIIDPISINDLEPLWTILDNPKILKVFHSARQDLEVLYQVAGRLPQSIFDTQIAAVFLGYGDLVGLAKAVEYELDVQLPKDQTRTNWSQRPLSDEQLAYAFDDVRYLAPLYEKIRERLSQEQLQALEDDFSALLNVNLYHILPEKAGDKLKAAKHLKTKNLAICYALAEWRELYAQHNNKPKRWVLSDDSLIAIAKRPPKTVQALYKVPNIKASSVKTYGEEWITIIDEIFASPDTWPESPQKAQPPSPQEEVLLSLALALCQQVALDYNIQLPNLASKAQLLEQIRSPEKQHFIGWRHLLIEVPLQKIFNTESCLKVNNGHLSYN